MSWWGDYNIRKSLEDTIGSTVQTRTSPIQFQVVPRGKYDYLARSGGVVLAAAQPLWYLDDNPQVRSSAAWLSDWAKRIKFTVDNTVLSGHVSDMPVPVFLNATAGKTNRDVTDIFSTVTGSQYKIAVTKGDGTTEMYVEVEAWNYSTSSAILWVGSTDWTLSASVATNLFLYYDATKANNTSYVFDLASGPSLWPSSYKGVYHMVDASVTETYDSTVNDNHGDKLDANEPIEAAAQVGQGQSFDGTDDEIDCGSDSSIDDMGDFVVSMWAQPSAVDCWLFSKGTTWTGQIDSSGNVAVTREYATDNGAWETTSAVFTTVSNSETKHIAVHFYSLSADIYVNGAAAGATETATPSGAASADAANSFKIGA